MESVLPALLVLAVGLLGLRNVHLYNTKRVAQVETTFDGYRRQKISNHCSN